MTTFLHLPFELQSLILTSAFTAALDLDLSAGAVRAYSSVPASHPSTKSLSISTLSPMHQCTHVYALFTQLLPLTLPPPSSPPPTAATDPIGMTGEAGAPDSESEGDDDDDTTISSNQLIHALRQVRKALQRDAEATKAHMREIVLRHPWARVAGEAYCSLWRRKERAGIVGEVVKAALAVVEGNELGNGERGVGVGAVVGQGRTEKEDIMEVAEMEVKEEAEEEEEAINEGFFVGEMVARCRR